MSRRLIDWRQDAGLAWWWVEDGAGNSYLYYYLYALERAGMLYDTSLIGNHDWYLDGAQVILAARSLGYKVLLYDGSFEDWSRKDYPVETAPKP